MDKPATIQSATAPIQDKMAETTVLRAKALTWLAQRGHRTAVQPSFTETSEDLDRLFEELRVYQAELEVQNEELRSSQSRTDQLLQRFSVLFQQAPICMLLIDRFGVIVDANDHAIQNFRLSNHHVRHHLLHRLVAEESRHKIESALLRVGAGPKGNGEVVIREIEMITGLGKRLNGDLSVMRLPTTESHEQEYLCVFSDQTALADQARNLRENAEQLKLYSKAFENVSDAVMITDLDGTILHVNRAFTRITGYKADEVLGQTPRMLASGHTPPQRYADLWRNLTAVGHWEGELMNRRPDGVSYPEWISIDTLADDQGRPWRYVAIFHDLTQTRAQEEQLRRLAYEDALTGLPNRHIMPTLLEQAFERGRRLGSKVGILFVDLDDFKIINDSLGHLTGDQALVEVAKRWRQRLRETDVLVRMGGDEFLVIAENLHDPTDASRIAQGLIDALVTAIQLREDEELFVGCSVGISLYPDDGSDAELLLQEADAAMYRAKTAGRGRFEFCSVQIMEQVRDELSIATDLRFALQRGELYPEFQPILPTQADLPTEVEALVRWRHPQKGLLYPGAFIGTAERTGLIHALSLFMLEESCRCLRGLLDAGTQISCVSVNVSFRDMDFTAIPELIGGILQRHRLEGRHLKLELTESDLMRNPEQTRHSLAAVRAMGVRIAVDDFGTGFSSLAYLRLLPLDTLKIDRSFVKSMHEDESSRAIVEMIVALARTIGLNVVAEGVETEQQAWTLRDMGVDYLQGWLYSRSVALEQVQATLSALPDLRQG
jgi:diguanylate cyclase (GGDEF)-like protein/PAS domain S-box-containing protein